VLLNHREPIDPLVVAERLVIIGDQAARLFDAPIEQHRKVQVAVEQEPGAIAFARARNDERLDDVSDYILVTDLAVGHVAALERLGGDPPRPAYNLGTGAGHSVAEVIERIGAISVLWGRT
jgi:hypothetical protein